MDAVEAEVSARAAREILESFQNNPEIMGGDPMFTDEAGARVSPPTVTGLLGVNSTVVIGDRFSDLWISDFRD